MSRRVATVAPEATAREAACAMRDRRLGGLVVATGERVVGIVTESDLVRRVLAEGKDAERVRVGDVMSSPVATIGPDATVEDCAVRMRDLKVKRLVVVLGDEMRGIVTMTDVVRVAPDLAKQHLDWVGQRWED